MSILKSAFLALFLAFGSLTAVAITATPAQAALTPQQQALVDLAEQRKVQLDAQMQPFIDIIGSGSSTAQERNEARAAIQLAQLRRRQMDIIIARTPTFSIGFLRGYTRSLTLVVSNNVSRVPV